MSARANSGKDFLMKRGTPEHIKTDRLMRILAIPRWQAVGILESLWHITARYAPCGDIGKWTDTDIASKIGYQDDTTILIQGLVDAGWLDQCPVYRLIVHDWQDHAEDAQVCRNSPFFV